MRILLAEDDTMIGEIVLDALRAEHYAVDWVKDGAVLIDAGYHPSRVGDIDLVHAAARSSAYTPVPGGVGPMTIASLITQTVESAERKYGI